MTTCLITDLGFISYSDAFALQRRLVAARKAGAIDDVFLLCEHPHVITLGRNANRSNLLASEPVLRQKAVELHETNRGGDITYHGPGQRVAYVMLDLKRRRPDVRAYVAALEEWIIRTLAAFNVRGERREDRVGVWVRRPEKGTGFEDKIAAIGIRVTRWVTLHGIALNIVPELSHFAGIVPCGVNETRYGVTSFVDLGHLVSMPEVDTILRREFESLFGLTARAV